MGKLDKLQTGVKKNSNSLFKDMTPLKARETEPSVKAKETPVIEKESLPTQTVNETIEVVGEKEKVEEIIRPVVEEEPVKTVADTILEKPEPVEESPTDVLSNVKTDINKSEEKPKKADEKTASRYEKDKFLLLDIRGYRDYVEHMSKAANMSATKYIRGLIEKDMEKNKDIYDAHKKLEQMLMNRS